MKCYFCSRDAAGQCQEDGRFACKKHSAMKSGKFVCLECNNGGKDSVKIAAVNELKKNVEKVLCGVCNIQLIPERSDFYNGFSTRLGDPLPDFPNFELLNKSDQDNALKQAFGKYSYRYRDVQCPNGCITCINHYPDSIPTGFFQPNNRRCNVCGAEFSYSDFCAE